jgi:hypothetical protein
MRTAHALLVALAALTMFLSLSTARADTSDAMCQVSKEGDTKHGASGPCTYSQRQGYVDIDLRNGETYSLAPGDKANHFKDQKGNKVLRTEASKGDQAFKWENGKKIVVTFTASPTAAPAPHASYTAGATAPDLADLVGAKAGQAEGDLRSRGYSYATGSTSGNAKYSSWYNGSTGRCVMIRTEEGRYQSIVETSPTDCGR